MCNRAGGPDGARPRRRRRCRPPAGSCRAESNHGRWTDWPWTRASGRGPPGHSPPAPCGTAPLPVERGRDMVADPLGEVEPCDGLAEGLLPVRCGAEPRGQPDAHARLEEDQLDGLFQHPPLFGIRESTVPVGGGTCLGLVQHQPIEESAGPGQPRREVAVRRTRRVEQELRSHEFALECLPLESRHQAPHAPEGGQRRGAHTDHQHQREQADGRRAGEDRDGDARTWPRAHAGWARGNASSAGRRGTAAGLRPGRVRGHSGVAGRIPGTSSPGHRDSRGHRDIGPGAKADGDGLRSCAGSSRSARSRDGWGAAVRDARRPGPRTGSGPSRRYRHVRRWRWGSRSRGEGRRRGARVPCRGASRRSWRVRPRRRTIAVGCRRTG